MNYPRCRMSGSVVPGLWRGITRTMGVLTVLLCVGAAWSASADDHGDNAATSTAIAVPESISGEISPGTDEDWFRFNATAGCSYTLETTLATLSDSRLSLYSTNGTTQLAFDDDGGVGLASRIDWTCPASGTYYAEVAAFSFSQTGTYTLDVTSPCVSCIDDHGNNAAGSTATTVPSVVVGDICPGTDIDWVRFDAVKGCTYTLETTLDTLKDTVLYLFDTDGTTMLAVDDDSGAGLASRIDWICPTSGTYYAEVTPANASQEGTYVVEIASLCDGCTDGHGNNASGATAVTMPDLVVGEICPDADVDWFRFSAVAGCEYTFTATLGTLQGSSLILFDSDGSTPLASDNDGGTGLTPQIQWTCPSSANYYVEVAPLNPSALGTYALMLSTPCGTYHPADINEDDKTNAVDIQLVINAALGLW
jgi:hypothetical protein